MSGAEEDPVSRRARSRRSIAFALAVSASLAAPFASRAEDTPADPGACTASYELGSGGEMRLRATCPVPLAESSRALAELLQAKYPNGRMTDDRATVEIGRIVDHPWLSKGLAEAAVRSPVWDAKRGSGRSGGNNGAVESIIDTRKLIQPWQAVFVRFGARARVASVEKVLVGEIGKTPALAAVPLNEATKGLEVPYDAILFLRLEPLPQF